jgi:hypothetical protein
MAARRLLYVFACVALAAARPRPLAPSIARAHAKAPTPVVETTSTAAPSGPAAGVAGVAAPLAVRGGGANNTNAATDGALFFGSFLYILAVRLHHQ